MKIAKLFFAITCSIIISDYAIASIPDREKSVDWQKDFTLPQASMFKKYFDKYMPVHLTPTGNSMALGKEIQSKITQKATDDFMGGEFFRKTPAGQALQKVEKATNKSITFGDAAKHEIVHTFKFHFKAMERNAEMNYSGYFNSNVIYNMDTSVANLSISKPLDEETSLSFVNSTNIYQVQLNPTVTLTHNF